MEENKERIKSIYDMMAELDDAGRDMAKVAAACIEIGVAIGMERAKAEKETEENRPMSL